MTFEIRYNTVSRITGTTEDWGVRTVGEAVRHPRAKAALNLPDKYNIYVSNVQVDASHNIMEGQVITVEKVAATKG